MRLISFKEYLELPPKPTEPFMSSPWEFDDKNLTLWLPKQSGSNAVRYEVNLEGCTTPSAILDCIFHIMGKFRATDEVLAALVRDLWLYLGSESCRDDRSATARSMRDIIEQNSIEANTTRGRAPRSPIQE